MTSLAQKLLAVLLGSASLTAFANTVSIQTTAFSDPVYSGYPGTSGTLVGYGGEFIGTESGLNLSSAYKTPGGADATSGYSLASDQFETFCVELNQDINANTPYRYTTSYAIDFPGGATEALPISVAWLYSEFVTGGLSTYGYYYGHPGSGGSDNLTRLQSSSDLQNGIWALMGENLGTNIDTPVIPSLSTLQSESSNPFIQAALNQFSNPEQAANGAYGVVVLNLVNSDGVPVQNQLAMVPDSGATIALLALSLAALGFVYSRRGGALAA